MQPVTPIIPKPWNKVFGTRHNESMRTKWILIAGLATGCVAAAQEVSPRHEVGLTLGGLLSTQRSGGSTSLDLGSGTALQANYGYRLLGNSTAALYGEVHFLANSLRDVGSTDQTLTSNVATIFLTPGVRVKFLPNRRIAPYFAVGGGWAVYEQSTQTLNGNPNSASRLVNHGAIDYGAGVDFNFWKFVRLRSEVRDFYAGGPSYNINAIRGGQHNVVAGGGLVLRFR